ncbi:MAG: VanW family protein [Chloroflexi bacterium]|nr:VanW family protein [Chloroflexota bacterium]
MKRLDLVKISTLGVACLVVLVVTALVGFEASSWNRVKPGVTVLDVNLGGLTLDQAQAQLAPRALAILDQPVQVQLDQSTWTTSARQLGVHLDPNDLATAAYAVGRDGTPLVELQAQVTALQTGVAVPVIGQADVSEVDALVQQIAQQVDTPAQSAQLTIQDDGTLNYVSSQPGMQLDQATSSAAIAQALTNGDPQVTLTARPLQPDVTTDQVSAAHDQLQRILAQPIRLTAADYSRTLNTSDIVSLVSLTDATAGQPASVSLNSDALQPLIDAAAKAVNQPASNARFAWDGAHLSVLRESHQGRVLDQDGARDALSTQLLAGAHTIDLPVTTSSPAVNSSDAAKLGIHELIEQSTTSFAGSVPEKAHNISLAAQRLNGVVVAPGATFSFNDEVGPTTLEAGFQWGYGLESGSNGTAHTVPSVAGGICQVATTLFQPVFWGGYQIEERYPHLYWIPAYTSRNDVGLDTTVDEDSGLDFQWTNVTQDYVLIQSSTSADKVTFSLYGNKPNWKVQVDPPQITNRVTPDTTPDVEAEPDLPWGKIVPVETARDGFQVVITRHVIPSDGSPERDLPLKSVYQPGRNVTLVGSGNAPTASAVSSTVTRVLAGMQGSAAPASAPAAAPASTPARTTAPATTVAPATTTSAPAVAAPAGPATFTTANGSRTLTQIRDELRNVGWGGGSDQDAVATYRHLADTASGH